MPPPDSTTSRADVVVVGGGPAGAAAATTLARGGVRVVLLDKARFPRDKICGDGLTTGALRRLDALGLEPTTVASWRVVDDMVLRTPSGRETTFALPRTGGQFAAVARRADLDAAVLDLARDAGATVLEGHACTAVTDHGDQITVHARGLAPLDASYLIAADGMWSPIRKMLGVAAPDYRGEWHAFRQYVHHVSPRASRELYVSFEPDFLPGYFWSFPVGEHDANIGFGIRRGGAFRVGAMKALWPEILARPHIQELLGPDATFERPHQAWPIPARVDQISHSAGRTLFVGDAAAATDALTGEGIGQALATGVWAAEAILAGGSSGGRGGAGAGALGRPEDVRATYERSIDTELVADHRMAELLSRAMSHRKGVRISVRLAGATDWTRRNFARWLFEDYPRALLATPRRWHRGMFTGPGAFRD